MFAPHSCCDPAAIPSIASAWPFVQMCAEAGLNNGQLEKGEDGIRDGDWCWDYEFDGFQSGSGHTCCAFQHHV